MPVAHLGRQIRTRGWEYLSGLLSKLRGKANRYSVSSQLRSDIRDPDSVTKFALIRDIHYTWGHDGVIELIPGMKEWLIDNNIQCEADMPSMTLTHLPLIFYSKQEAMWFKLVWL